MKTRIKELRKVKKLSQKEFGQNINLSQNHISSLENGTRTITDRIVNDICTTYNINKDWLLTGTGEMFEDPLSAFVIKDKEVQQFVKAFYEMDETSQKNIKALVMNWRKK